MSRGGLYLFLGADRPRKLQRLQELERTLGVQPFDRHQVDPTVTGSAELVALCRLQPAMSPVRLIVVDQAQRLERSCIEALQHHAPAIVQTACVVLLVETELSVRHPLAQVGARSDDCGQNALGGVAIERFPAREAPAAKPFALTEALSARDAAGALAALQDQLLAGKEPLELLGLVAWQLQRWISVKRLLTAGYSVEQIISVTGWRVWQVERLRSEVRQRSLASLRESLERCWRFDVDAKSGRTIPELAVEQLVVEISTSGISSGI